MTPILGISLLAAIAFVTLIWVLSLVLRDASIIDIFWGMGFVLMSGVYFSLTDGYLLRKLLVSVLVVVWGLRLSIHIFARNRGKGEDFRYGVMRSNAGQKFWWTSLFKVFWLQGALFWLISIPLLAAQFSPTPARLTAFDVVGTIVWCVGFFFEAVGDWQLARFKQNPENEGKLLTSGLWATTRHPNYFGDALLWWGFFLIALGTPFGFTTVFSPILMTFLLMRISGVAMLERTLADTKPGYRAYIQSTNAFVPWFPRK